MQNVSYEQGFKVANLYHFVTALYKYMSKFSINLLYATINIYQDMCDEQKALSGFCQSFYNGQYYKVS